MESSKVGYCGLMQPRQIVHYSSHAIHVSEVATGLAHLAKLSGSEHTEEVKNAETFTFAEREEKEYCRE